MKTLLTVLLLSALSFGQMPMTKAQKQDCSKLTKAFKKHATDPGLTPDDVAAMLAAVHEACGTSEEHTTATQDCENAIEAVNQDVKKNGPDPTLSRTDLKLLLEAMHQACGMPEDYAAKHDSHAIGENTRETIAKEKERIDGIVGNTITASDSPPDIHEQMPESKAHHQQRQDCSNAKDAIKTSGTDPNLTPKDLRTLLANLQQACGTPDDSQPAQDIRKVVVDCSMALIAFDKNITAPNLPTNEFIALGAAVYRDCRTRPGFHDSQTDSQPTPEAKDSQPTPAALDIHELVAQKTTALNREIALGNRLIAHLQKAQTWEGIDADHPEAVALREKIAGEEKELRQASLVSVDLNDKIDMKRVQKQGTVEEINSLTHIVQEATAVLNEVNTQRDRYHALGY